MVTFSGCLMVFLYGWKNVTARLAIGLVCVAEEDIVVHYYSVIIINNNNLKKIYICLFIIYI